MASKWPWLIKEWLRVWTWYPFSVYEMFRELLDIQIGHYGNGGFLLRLWCLKGAFSLQWTATLYYLSVAYEDKYWKTCIKEYP